MPEQMPETCKKYLGREIRGFTRIKAVRGKTFTPSSTIRLHSAVHVGVVTEDQRSHFNKGKE